MSAAAKPVLSPLTGTVLSCPSVGDVVSGGRTLIVIESMKMEHVVEAPENVTVSRVWVAVGDTVREGQMLVEVVAATVTSGASDADPATTPGDRVDVARL
ncbi:MAG: acetyl-CoA carboxylase biotin carboxyl carrier protein subunit, partial [Ilumatobacteraceae bacterium]